MPKCRAHLMKSVRVDPKVGSQLEVVNHQRVAIRVRRGHKLRGLIVSLPFQPAAACFPSWSGLHQLIMAFSFSFFFFFHSANRAQQLDGWANGKYAVASDLIYLNVIDGEFESQ